MLSLWVNKYWVDVPAADAADHQMKEKYIGRPSTHWRRPVFWDVLPASCCSSYLHALLPNICSVQWEKESYDSDRPSYVYPSADLITCLLDLYFTNVHPTLPILHRPSFERSVAEGLHLVDMEFGSVCLPAIILASRLLLRRGLLLAVLAIASWVSSSRLPLLQCQISLPVLG
jgi:hypothetical protein